MESRNVSLAAPTWRAESALRIRWVCAPPGRGLRGAHDALQNGGRGRGARARLHAACFDKNSDDVARHEQVIRRYWPQIRAEIRRSAHGRIEGIDALVASSWGTAHVVARRLLDRR